MKKKDRALAAANAAALEALARVEVLEKALEGARQRSAVTAKAASTQAVVRAYQAEQAAEQAAETARMRDRAQWVVKSGGGKLAVDAAQAWLDAQEAGGAQ